MILGILVLCDTTIDIITNVGHFDLYFIVLCDTTIDIITNVGHLDLYFMVQ